MSLPATAVNQKHDNNKKMSNKNHIQKDMSGKALPSTATIMQRQ